MFFSIIISTHNRETLLLKLIRSIERLDTDVKYELLVIDNNSSDSTQSVVEALNQNSPIPIKYFFEEKPGLHNARHRGALESSGDILCYLDDDVVVDPLWLTAIYDIFKCKRNVALAGGKILPVYEEKPPEWMEAFWHNCEEGRYLDVLALLDLGNIVKKIDPGFIWGCNFSIRKDVLYQCGGFHPDSFPEHLIKYRGDGECGLARKIKERGYQSYYAPGACVYHYIPRKRMTVEYFCKRMFSQGISDKFTEIRNKQKVGNDINLKIEQAYLEGKAFYLQSLLDKKLQEWVLKPDFF